MKFSHMLFVILLSGCCTNEFGDLYVTNKDVPVEITETGTFVSESEMVDLLNGNFIKYRNSHKGDLYLSERLIDIKDGKVKLKDISE